MTAVVLASASPRRRELLVRLGFDVDVCPADVDEQYLVGESPEEHVERLARSKAETVRPAAGDRPVVAGDTVVVDGTRVLTKPEDEEGAVHMLLSLSGREHQVLSGIALAYDGRTTTRVVRTAVRFREFDEAAARAYVATGEPMDKAGAYGIQGLGAALVASIDGDYYSVVGFPIAAFLALLEERGLPYRFGSAGASLREGAGQ